MRRTHTRNDEAFFWVCRRWGTFVAALGTNTQQVIVILVLELCSDIYSINAIIVHAVRFTQLYNKKKYTRAALYCI